MWDAVVIGSGIGGLSCAGRLAAAGRKVLVLEKAARPGGYLASFSRGPFSFDAAVDCYAGLDPDGLLTWLLRALGVDGEVPRVRLDPIRWSRFPGLSVRVDADRRAYIERLERLFPAERKGIEGFFRAADGLYDDVEGVMAAARGERAAPALPPALARYWTATFSEFVAAHVRDRRLAAVLSDRCPFLGLAPGRVSAIRMISLIVSYFRSGAWRPVGGHQRLVDAIAGGIRRRGGEVRSGKGVDRIILEQGRAAGVVAEDGEEFRARHVVAAGDWTDTCRRLLGIGGEGGRDGGLPAPSVSFFILYGGLRGDLPWDEPASSIGSYDTFDLERFLSPYRPFRDSDPLGITIPTVEDPSLAPPGHHVVLVHELIPRGGGERWAESKARRTEDLVRKTERVLPGWTARIAHLEAATPETLRRYTGNRGGAAFGWEQVPVLPRIRHGIANLHLAGHWTETGGGVLAAALSGLRAAARIVEARE